MNSVCVSLLMMETLVIATIPSSNLPVPAHLQISIQFVEWKVCKQCSVMDVNQWVSLVTL